MTPQELFEAYKGIRQDDSFPVIEGVVQETNGGTPYLTQPGVALLSKPSVNPNALDPFLNGFAEDLGFRNYTSDSPVGGYYGTANRGAQLAKIAGQLCYMSVGEKRTKNADAGKYLDHIKQAAHGSVLEHAQYSFLLYGISRSLTHELVRHRVGTAFSQVSQRYVDGKVLRFVERPEYQANSYLHIRFLNRIDTAYKDYHTTADTLLEIQNSGGMAELIGEKRTDAKKKVQQCARSLLPNETEAPMVFSANVRALRHIIEMRASEGAEIEIRALAVRLFLVMHQTEPLLFSDYELVLLPDNTYAVKTPYRKV